MRKLTGGLQEGIVTLLCFDTTQGAKHIAGLVDPKILDPYFRTIATELIDFLNKYSKPAGEHILEVIDEIKQRKPEEAEIYDKLYGSILQTKENVNREYVVGKLGVFVRIQRAKATMTKCLPLLNRHDESSINEVEGILSGLAKQNVDLADSGTILNDPKQALRFLDRADDEYFPLGIKPIDDQFACPRRKKLWLGIAGTNVGKTAAAVHTGKVAWMMGRKVLHVTLEDDENAISQRYLQALFSISIKEAEDYKAQFFKKDKLGRMVSMDLKSLGKRPYIHDKDIRSVLIKKMQGMKNRPRLIIKEFPAGQLTIRAFKAYLSHLESAHNFIPDEMILDFPKQMKLSPKYMREELGILMVDFRGIASEYNAAFCTYAQSNRLGLTAKLIDINKIGEDVSGAQTADVVVTLNQTDVEYRMGLARLYVAKNRNGGEKKFQVLISQAMPLCQFALSSTRMVDSVYWPLVEGNGADDESED